jgi:transposase
MIRYALGIDISMKSFQVCLSTLDTELRVKVVASRKFTNNPAGFKELTEWIKKHCKQPGVPLVILMEATGVYYENCALYLLKAGYRVSVVLPNKAKRYLQSKGHKSKNDKIDAQGLSQMAAEQTLEPWQPMQDYFYTLRSLTRHHESLQAAKTQFSNQLHALQNGMYVNREVEKQLQIMVATLEDQILQMQKAIEKHLGENEAIKQKVEGIVKIKGLGLLSVATVIAETNGFALFENTRQLVSFAGYDVVENQSGSHQGKTRISKKGNSHIRRMLHMPALTVVRYKVAPFISLFERTLEKHHIKMKSYVAVQKKLLILIYTLWKKAEAFNEEYPGQTTRDEEAAHPSRLSFAEADLTPVGKGRVQKSSHAQRRDYTRCTTVEVSAFAPSRLL